MSPLRLTSIELGLGDNVALSAAKPTRLSALDQCEVIEYVTNVSSDRLMLRLTCSIGAAAWFTIFIVRSVEVADDEGNIMGSFPIWPVEVQSATTCIACFEIGVDLDPIMCEKVCLMNK